MVEAARCGMSDDVGAAGVGFADVVSVTPRTTEARNDAGRKSRRRGDGGDGMVMNGLGGWVA
ncbi:MAG: hypothetical protein CMJ54_07205 [Planctomycetaceae bacterium]|nr:hypothetical protein [Planctomycetaceae bacterium]